MIALALEVYIAGAGLYVVYQLVEEARGRVELDSATLVMALIWPAWVAFVVLAVILALVLVAFDRAAG